MPICYNGCMNNQFSLSKGRYLTDKEQEHVNRSSKKSVQEALIRIKERKLDVNKILKLLR